MNNTSCPLLDRLVARHDELQRAEAFGRRLAAETIAAAQRPTAVEPIPINRPRFPAGAPSRSPLEHEAFTRVFNQLLEKKPGA